MFHAIVGFWVVRFPLESNDPGNNLQKQGDSGQNADCNDVSHSPFVIDTQDLEAFKDVGDAQGDDSVSDQVMVDIPIESVFMILVWSEE